MRTVVGGDVLEGSGWGYGSGSGGCGIWVFAFLVVFLVVIIFAWRRNDNDCGVGLGGLAALAPLLGGFAGFNGGARYNVEEDRVEQARDTRRIICDANENAREILQSIDNQTHEVEKAVTRNLIEGKDDEIAALREKLNEMNQVRLFEKQLLALERVEDKITGKIEQLEDKTICKPEFIPYGFYEGRHNGNGNGCCES